MPIGTLKRFNAARGFGFIAPDSEVGPECFVHISTLARAGIKDPKPGAPLVYEIGERNGKECAVSVEPLKAWQIDSDDDN